MFDKSKFAQLLKSINDTYESQREFSKKSEINRTYLSQYMNMKLEEPPKPKILQKLANASNNIVTYNELMNICGYTDDVSLYKAFLEDNLSELKATYLNKLNSNKLTFEEEEVFTDIESMLPNEIFYDMSTDEVKAIIYSYFDNMDFLSNPSKEKVISQLLLFVEYCNATHRLHEKINSLTRLSNKEDFETITAENWINQNRYKKEKYVDGSMSYGEKFFMCPVYGRISAGQPNWAEECIEGRIPIDPVLFDIVNPEEHFFLRVNR